MNAYICIFSPLDDDLWIFVIVVVIVVIVVIVSFSLIFSPVASLVDTDARGVEKIKIIKRESLKKNPNGRPKHFKRALAPACVSTISIYLSFFKFPKTRNYKTPYFARVCTTPAHLHANEKHGQALGGACARGH